MHFAHVEISNSNLLDARWTFSAHGKIQIENEESLYPETGTATSRFIAHQHTNCVLICRQRKPKPPQFYPDRIIHCILRHWIRELFDVWLGTWEVNSVLKVTTVWCRLRDLQTQLVFESENVKREVLICSASIISLNTQKKADQNWILCPWISQAHQVWGHLFVDKLHIKTYN